MIKNIAFDLGGVVLALSYEQAVERFEKIGLKDACLFNCNLYLFLFYVIEDGIHNSPFNGTKTH